jgi:hypothetical protein
MRHVAGMTEIRKSYEILVEDRKEREYLTDLSVYGKVAMHCVLEVMGYIKLARNRF